MMLLPSRSLHELNPRSMIFSNWKSCCDVNISLSNNDLTKRDDEEDMMFQYPISNSPAALAVMPEVCTEELFKEKRQSPYAYNYDTNLKGFCTDEMKRLFVSSIQQNLNCTNDNTIEPYLTYLPESHFHFIQQGFPRKKFYS